MPTEALVELAGVSFAYGSEMVLSDVSLRLRPGGLVGLVGPSGAGKTTLLKLIAGTLEPTAGTVTRLPGLRVGWVPQVETVNWWFPITVDEVVLMGSTAAGAPPFYTRSERERVHDLLHDLGIGHLEGRHIRALSGGQQQRVFVARALMARPHLLLLDEPMSGVDVKTRLDMLELLSAITSTGICAVLTTHDLNGVAAHLPEVAAINRGIAAHGRPADVLVPGVLRRVFGAEMEIIQHHGHPIVIDRHDRVVPLPHAGEKHAG